MPKRNKHWVSLVWKKCPVSSVLYRKSKAVQIDKIFFINGYYRLTNKSELWQNLIEALHYYQEIFYRILIPVA